MNISSHYKKVKKGHFQTYYPNSVLSSSASEPKKGTLHFISVQRVLYPVLYRTTYKYRKRFVIHN